MKILLAQPNNRSYVIMPSLGIGYLAAVLRSDGHEVSVLNCMVERLSPREFGKRAADLALDVVGFQLFSQDLNIAKEYMRAAKTALPRAVLVAGGAHPSGDPEGTLNHLADLDFAFAGEAETGFPLLVRRLAGDSVPLQEIPGLAYRHEGRIASAQPVLVHDLDSLPLPAWDLLKPEQYPEAPHGAFTRSFPTAPIITSRGCPCRCTFCAGKSITSRNLRLRSLESVMEELGIFHQRGIREFHIEDENFTINRERTLRFCEMVMRQGYGMSWSLPSGVRIDTLDAEILDAMEQAGCYSLALGIEFGSDRIMKLTRKGIDREMIEKRLSLFHGRRIKTTGFFLFGVPGETMQEMEETVQFALKLPLDRAQFNNYMPLPGSVLWDELKERGELDTVHWSRFFVHDVSYAGPGIEPARLKRLQRKAYLRFYLRQRVAWGLLSEIRSWRHFIFLVKRLMDSLRWR